MRVQLINAMPIKLGKPKQKNQSTTAINSTAAVHVCTRVTDNAVITKSRSNEFKDTIVI